MTKFSFFILNICINSFLSFATTVLLIESLIFIFRVKQGRGASFLRMISIIKLPVDLCLYDFSRWSYTHGINPLLCEKGSRTLSVHFGWCDSLIDWFRMPFASGIQMKTTENMTFTLADILGYYINPFTLNVLCFVFLLFTLGFLVKTTINCACFFQKLRRWQETSIQGKKKIRNFRLKQLFKNGKLRLTTTTLYFNSPFVAGFITPIIYFPAALEKALSRREYEAVLAHEYEHMKYKDNIVRLLLHWIGTLFWWVPTTGLLKCIEEGQEIGCDLKCGHYAIHSLDLASAICKSTRVLGASPNHSAYCYHLAHHTLPKRINLLVQNKPARFKYFRLSLFILTIGLAFLMILFGRFWIF